MRAWVLVAAASAAVLSAASAQESEMLTPPENLLEDVPGAFPRFAFEGHDETAQVMNRFLWHHFSSRGVEGRTLFWKEYLSLADMWLNGFRGRDNAEPVQNIYRRNFLGIEIEPSGYVKTHQHFSHAHDSGWPFPMWTQAWPTGGPGLTAGWHFQPIDAVPGWVGNDLRNMKFTQFTGEEAAAAFELQNCVSKGIAENAWVIEASGESPTITTPEDVPIAADCSPFLQLRWTREPENVPPSATPYVEWMREEDEAFGPERRMCFYPERNDHSAHTGMWHSHMPMHTHPLWDGAIKRMRICLAPGESDVSFRIDSFFTVFDTRHTINNPLYVMGSWNYFRWTCDLPFLRQVINRLRNAVRYQQTVLGGLDRNHIRNPWPGHSGRPGFKRNPDGSKNFYPGRGIGNNYWDLMPFGYDDMYATSEYYGSLLALAAIEEAILENPGWDIPRGALAYDPADLRAHAADVKRTANEKFWNPETGRFFSAIDIDGNAYDYGHTFLNLEAIWYGIASEEHARAIMAWLDGERIVAGDTSQGEDIYRWRFGPRATTKRNIDWYGFMWTGPETIPWGGQVQDGGGVLGFTFYDLWARIHVLGPDNAWRRMSEIADWEQDVWAEGGYRAYYAGGKRGTTLQGGGTAGGLGIDHEFYESKLFPAIVLYGFMGVDPGGDTLHIEPRLPSDVPSMLTSNVRYRGALLDIQVGRDEVIVNVKESAVEPVKAALEGNWTLAETGQTGPVFTLSGEGRFVFRK